MRFIRNKSAAKKMSSENEPPKIHSIKELFRLSLPQKYKILAAFVCVLLINTAVLVKPYILSVVIDDFLVNQKTQHGVYSITAMALLYLALSLMSSFLSYTQVNLVNRAGQEIIRNLRQKVFKTIQLLPLSYLDKTSSGRLITRATNDIEELNELYINVIIDLLKDLFLLGGIVYVMFALNVELTLVSFIVIPIIILIVMIIKRKIRLNFFDMKHFIGKINGFMAENISGMKIIQIFRRESEKKKEFDELNDAYFKTTLIQIKLNSILKPAASLLENLAIAILIWYGMSRIGNNTLDIGILYAFTTYIKQFFTPISELSEKYNSIQSALVSTERIFEILNQENSLEDIHKGISFDTLKGTIEFKNVWFSYNDKDWVLKDISFKIGKGETTAFVGETGAGKTTIISLINGFYKIQKGEILIDGVNINDINLKSLRKNIGVILQDVFLFSGNIRENITLHDDITEKQIEEALTLSHADTFVSRFAEGLDEPVMERGNTLSAGQRQLISFARVIAHNPAVFVLDEATANIDSHTEKLIQKAIENVAHNRTTLIIAHRLSTIRNADKIIVLKNGEICEMGNHEELVSKGGYYKKLLTENKLKKDPCSSVSA